MYRVVDDVVAECKVMSPEPCGDEALYDLKL